MYLGVIAELPKSDQVKQLPDSPHMSSSRGCGTPFCGATAAAGCADHRHPISGTPPRQPSIFPEPVCFHSETANSTSTRLGLCHLVRERARKSNRRQSPRHHGPPIQRHQIRDQGQDWHHHGKTNPLQALTTAQSPRRRINLTLNSSTGPKP